MNIQFCGVKNLRKTVNDLMEGYQWQSIAPDNGELETSIDHFPWVSNWPMVYHYKQDSKKPFKGNCIEQTLYIKAHIPEAAIAYFKWIQHGVNSFHVEVILNDGGICRTVFIEPKDGNYLSRRKFWIPRNFIRWRCLTCSDQKKEPVDVYILKTIPAKGDAQTLFEYVKANGEKARFRGGRLYAQGEWWRQK